LENIEKLKKIGVVFLLPRVEEGKAKIALTEDIAAAVIGLCVYGRILAGRRVLVSLGRTVEHIDPVRVVTNNSTGKMGAALARAALALGAEVTVAAGKVSAPLPPGARTLSTATAAEMLEAVKAELTGRAYDHFIAAAAVGDWAPAAGAGEKISTHDKKNLTLELTPTPKIIDRVKDWAPGPFSPLSGPYTGFRRRSSRRTPTRG